MATWNRLLLLGSQKLLKPNGLFSKFLPKNDGTRCMSGDRTMIITASRWQWHKTKDMLHLYVMVGAIPIAIIVFTANVFIGPATLEPIPEGYTPQHWEYYRSPITRFFARYFCPNPQQEYEKYMHHLVHNYEIKKLRDVQSAVKTSIRYHQDYPAFSYKRSLQVSDIKKHRERLDTVGVF
ncbi:NADH dehydrogenase (ubiquinone) SGDH subunit [Calliopsis andreniformis]|uniref:NADH dehydrogenase (ubiquinone) SGDH subunit n=1 Tax=Calliopsis andreniformis TaxID=337506 RepID=UPI003FCDBB73